MPILGEFTCSAKTTGDRHRCGGELHVDAVTNLFTCSACGAAYELVRVGETGFDLVKQQPASPATPIPWSSTALPVF